MKKNSKTSRLFNDPGFQQYIRDCYHIDSTGNLVGPRGRVIKGANNGNGYRIVTTYYRGKGFCVLAHRIVMFLHLGRVPVEIDHIDNDRSNNNLNNLREITRSKNVGKIAKTTRPTTSQYKGVSWHAKNKRWTAMCAQRYVGSFECEHDAASAYDQAAFKHFGPDAWLNFPLTPRV